MNIIDKLNALKVEFENGIVAVSTLDELLQFKSKFLGKTGALSEVLKGLRDASPEDRPKVGGLANTLRDSFEAGVQA
ncbi:MAG: phenylalanine--tRNA ligase subunit alpha, partial [Bdellovibrionota bacterium]